MIRSLATVAVLGVAVPVAAQFPHRPVIGYTISYGPVFGGGFWVVTPPPVVIIRTPAQPRVEMPWEPEPEPIRTDPVVKAATEARVDAAVKNGDLIVFKPVKAVARVPAPPERIDLPAPAAKPAVTLDPPKVPVDPKALAAFRVDAGRAAFAADEYGRAAGLFRAAAATDPLAFFLLAQAHTARGEYTEAVAAIRSGMGAAPDWPAARFGLADVYGDRRARLADHLTALRAAADAQPADPAARFLYAYHLWFAGERAAAVKVLRALSPLVKDNAVIERFLHEAVGKDL